MASKVSVDGFAVLQALAPEVRDEVARRGRGTLRERPEAAGAAGAVVGDGGSAVIHEGRNVGHGGSNGP